MCANACKTYLLQKQCINLVSSSSVVQAEITSSKIFLVAFRSAKYYYPTGTLRNGREPSRE